MALHRFEASEFPCEFGGHEPVLVVAPGDTVVTRTIDAYGGDKSGVRVSVGDNPLSGPFLVTGAQPGDTLSVELVELTPNREYGYGESSVVPNVVDPGYVRSLPPVERLTWWLDREANTAHLVEPAVAMPPVVLKLAPMLGCLGVAPPRGQVLWSGTAGRHGGNMDYRRIVQGVMIHLPVFVPGAHLYLGDGHATQGAGEIGGTAIEVSMDVRFKVALRKGGEIRWPRGEDARWIWTIGNARPLEQALQHATTEMLRWLQQDFGLDARAAAVLLSQLVEYDVGNVCDPAFTMVCRIPKDPHLMARRLPS